MEIEANAASAADDAALFNEMTAPEPPQSAPEPVQISEQPKMEEPKADAQPEPPKSEPQIERDTPRVPLSELIEERKARQALERQMAEFLQTMKASQPAPPPPPPAPEWFEDPKGFVHSEVAPHLRQQQEAMIYNSRLIAEARFGEQAVREAEAAFNELVASQRMHPADYAKINGSPNPFAEAVKWHREQSVLSEIGGDPNAFKQKLRSDLLNDPEFRKEAMAAWQRQAASPQRGTAPPINLPSLQKVGSAALPQGQEVDLNDNDLWQSVITRAGR